MCVVRRLLRSPFVNRSLFTLTDEPSSKQRVFADLARFLIYSPHEIIVPSVFVNTTGVGNKPRALYLEYRQLRRHISCHVTPAYVIQSSQQRVIQSFNHSVNNNYCIGNERIAERTALLWKINQHNCRNHQWCSETIIKTWKCEGKGERSLHLKIRRDSRVQQRASITRLVESWKFTTTGVTAVAAIIMRPMGEIRTIWDELCKYCVGDNRRAGILA